jgi:flagellar biosynthesis chaperone FliJ
MKTTRPTYSARAVRGQKERAKQNYEQALRACETAAARIKAAGDELAQCWTALCQEISAGVSPTDLLRKRAWCNVLELRLKEQAHALEDARLGVDALWDEMMLTARARELFHRFLKKRDRETPATDESLPLLARAAAALAATHRRGASLKK